MSRVSRVLRAELGCLGCLGCLGLGLGQLHVRFEAGAGCSGFGGDGASPRIERRQHEMKGSHSA